MTRSQVKPNAWAKARNYEVYFRGSQIGNTLDGKPHGKQNIEECLVEMKEQFDAAEANNTHFSATLSFQFGHLKVDMDKAEKVADDFIALFPKYVKLHKTEWRGAEYTRNPQGGFGCTFGVSYDSDRDGKANETGRKRFNKFCHVLRHWDMV
jgi:hypothetical protein